MEPISVMLLLLFVCLAIWVISGLLAALAASDGFVDDEVTMMLGLLSTTAFLAMLAAGIMFFLLAVANMIAGG